MKKSSTTLGFVFFLLSAIPLCALLSSFSDLVVGFFNRVTIFIPIILGVVGLIFSVNGEKDWPKFGLIVGNILSIGAWALLLFVAIFGFQAP